MLDNVDAVDLKVDCKSGLPRLKLCLYFFCMRVGLYVCMYMAVHVATQRHP